MLIVCQSRTLKKMMMITIMKLGRFSMCKISKWCHPIDRRIFSSGFSKRIMRNRCGTKPRSTILRKNNFFLETIKLMPSKWIPLPTLNKNRAHLIMRLFLKRDKNWKVYLCKIMIKLEIRQNWKRFQRNSKKMWMCQKLSEDIWWTTTTSLRRVFFSTNSNTSKIYRDNWKI